MSERRRRPVRRIRIYIGSRRCLYLRRFVVGAARICMFIG
jgi:hypothetical protein